MNTKIREENRLQSSNCSEVKSPASDIELLDDHFRSLAGLSPVEYDRRREDEAKNLGIRVSTLDDQVKQLRTKTEDNSQGQAFAWDEVEPWGETVCGDSLLCRIVEMFHAFAILPTGAAEALSLWILNTYVFDCFFHLPILLIDSPEKRCGKTTVLSLLNQLCNRPLSTSNISMAAVFRTIDKWKPTLLIDEADTFLGRNDEMTGLINSGHTKTAAFTIRCTGEDNEPRPFSTWAPKVIAMIGEAPGTIIDRSVRVRLRRKLDNEVVKKINHQDGRFKKIQKQCARWAADNSVLLQRVVPKPLDTPNDRAADNWSPLLAIAAVVGGEWSNRARESARLLLDVAARAEPVTARIQLLMDIRQIYTICKKERLTSTEIVSHLNKLEGHPWAEWKNGGPMTVHQIAGLLKDFGIRPKTIRFGTSTAKGYSYSAFKDAFTRYLPAEKVTSEQFKDFKGLPNSQSVTSLNDVTGEDLSNWSENNRSFDVTADTSCY